MNVVPAFMNLAKTCNFSFPGGTTLNADGYPTAVTFFRERLVFARDETAWFSVSADFENYATEIDRTTGQTYRRLVSVTRVEKGKTGVEFENDVVTAVEESEDRQGGNVRIIVPPLFFRW